MVDVNRHVNALAAKTPASVLRPENWEVLGTSFCLLVKSSSAQELHPYDLGTMLTNAWMLSRQVAFCIEYINWVLQQIHNIEDHLGDTEVIPKFTL